MNFIKVSDFDTGCVILVNLRYIISVREAKVNDVNYSVIKMKEKGILKIKESIDEMCNYLP